MRSILLVLTAVALASSVAAAPKAKTPFEATIEVDEVYVRSGAGSSKYYPTAKLRRGDKVIVHRQDPGGWYMIAPPPGSFSWVPAKYVKQIDKHRGAITANNVAVRVGSFESDVRDVFQRTLSENDEVRIINEKKLVPESGSGPPESWYRIEPPRGEWRWIPGTAVTAVQGGDRVPREDPFVSPEVDTASRRSAPRAPRAEDGAPSFEEPLTDTPAREYVAGDSGYGAPLESARENRPLVRKGGKPSKSPPVSRPKDDLFDELDRLDVRFKAILDGPILDWDFDQIERDYISLRSETETTNIQRMIDTRLDRITGYRQTQSEEREIARIQDETSRRDAELAEVQRRQETQLISARPPQKSQFDGAGIVARAALRQRGAPRYALLNPNGKVLAYLMPAPGIDLERWLGKSVGVVGPRGPEPQLRADLITVNRLTPVRLTP